MSSFLFLIRECREEQKKAWENTSGHLTTTIPQIMCDSCLTFPKGTCTSCNLYRHCHYLGHSTHHDHFSVLQSTFHSTQNQTNLAICHRPKSSPGKDSQELCTLDNLDSCLVHKRHQLPSLLVDCVSPSLLV